MPWINLSDPISDEKLDNIRWFLFAARWGTIGGIEIVQTLLDHNANLNLQAINGYYPLYIAGTYLVYIGTGSVALLWHYAKVLALLKVKCKNY